MGLARKAQQYDNDDKRSITMAEWPSNANEHLRSQTTNRDSDRRGLQMVERDVMT